MGNVDIKKTGNDAAFFLAVFLMSLLGISIFREEIAYGIAYMRSRMLAQRSLRVGKIQASRFDIACLEMVEAKK